MRSCENITVMQRLSCTKCTLCVHYIKFNVHNTQPNLMVRVGLLRLMLPCKIGRLATGCKLHLSIVSFTRQLIDYSTIKIVW